MSEKMQTAEEKKIFVRELIITNMICLVPIILGFSLWNILPDNVAIHFDINGEPDRVVPKLRAILELPLLMLPLNTVIQFLAHRENIKEPQNYKVKRLLVWSVPLVTLPVSCLLLIKPMFNELNVIGYSALFAGFLLVVVGNYLPKTTPNKLIGYRLPCLMHNEELWQKTNRLGGKIMVVAGFITMMVAFTPAAFLVMILSFLAGTVVPSVYAEYKNITSKH